MLVILAIAAIAILACVVLVSLGRGGELTEFPPDVPPLDLPEPGQLTAVDFMALQLPVNLVGYHTGSVDETLRRAASAISARDTRIAVLEQRVSELLSSRLHARQEVYAAPGAGLRTDHSPDAQAVARELPESGDPVSASGTTVSWDRDVELTHPPEWRLPAAGDAAAANGEPDAAVTSGDGQDAHAEEPPADQPDEPVGEADAALEDGEQADDGDHEPAETAEAGDETKPGDDAPADDEPDEAGEIAAGESANGTGEREEPVRASSGKDGDARS